MPSDNIGIGHRLLWAEAIDDDYTAIVIQYGGQFIGGIAMLQRFEMCSWGFSHHIPAIMDLKFIFQWFKVVDSVDEFRRSKSWQTHKAITQQAPRLAAGDAEVLRIASSPKNQEEQE